MANYCGFTRTNYFRVTDADRLRKIVDNAYLSEDKLDLFERKVGDETYYSFGCYDSIEGLHPNWERDELEDDDPSFDLFAEELQMILHPDDAIIITEVGYEKLRYLTAYSMIITAKECKCIDLQNCAIEKVRELLGNPKWDTTMEY